MVIAPPTLSVTVKYDEETGEVVANVYARGSYGQTSRTINTSRTIAVPSELAQDLQELVDHARDWITGIYNGEAARALVSAADRGEEV